MPNPEIDVGDEKQVGRRKKKHQIRRERELDEIRQLLNVPWGRGFLSRMLDSAYVFRTISDDDAMAMSRKSGRRDLGLELIRDVTEADPNGYLKLIQERVRRESDGGDT